MTETPSARLEAIPAAQTASHNGGLLGRRIQIAGLSLAASLLILIHYSTFVDGFIFPAIFYQKELSLAGQLASLVMAVAPSLWMPNRLGRVSDPIVLTLYLIGYLPIALLLPRLTHNGVSGFASVAAVLAGMGLIEFMRNLPHIRTTVSLQDPVLFRRGLILASLICTIVALAAYGMPTQLIGLDYVYVARGDFNAEASAGLLNTAANYLIHWNLIVFLPYICVTSVGRRSTTFSVAYFFITAFLYFNITTYQIMLMIPAALLGFYFIYRDGSRRNLSVIVGGFCVLLIAGGLISWLFRGTELELVASMPVYRFVHIAGMLGSLYLDSFNIVQTVKAVEGVHPGYVIGSLYFGDDTMLATTSFWFIAFSEFRYIGILAVSALLGLYLWVLDCVVDRSFAVLIFSLSGIIAYFLAGAGLGTAMVTYGLIPLLALCALAPRLRAGREA